jgi:hypothetical protein
MLYMGIGDSCISLSVVSLYILHLNLVVSLWKTKAATITTIHHTDTVSVAIDCFNVDNQTMAVEGT